MASPEDYIIRFTDPARSDGELTGTFVIKPFTIDGPQHPTIDVVFDDPDTGTGISKQSPVVLFGKGLPQYGEQHANNLLQLAENFAGASEPLINASGNPLPGVTWFRDERYWVDTAGQDIFVWDDIANNWVDVSLLSSTNSVTFDLAANRPAVGSSTSGDYFFATDTQQLSMFYVWADYVPPISRWLDRISRIEAFSPSSEYPRRNLTVYDATDEGSGPRGFVKLIGFNGNEGDPMTGPLILNGDPIVANQAANKNYVDTEIAAAIGGSNELYQLLDVNNALDATTGSSLVNNEFIFFNTALAGGGYDGQWDAKLLTAADITDFVTQVQAEVTTALAASSIDDLSDVDLTGITTDDILVWNGTNFEAQPDKYVLGNLEPSGAPYTVQADPTNAVDMLRSDGVTVTIENVTAFTDFQDHTNGTAFRHEADQIDYDNISGPIGVGTPANVEEAIVLLDSAIASAAGGYTSIGGTGLNASGTATVNSGEAPAGTLNFSSGNSRLTITVADDSPDDNILFTVNEVNLVIANMFDAATHGVDHSGVSVVAAGDSGLGFANNDLTSNIGLFVDIENTTTESSVDGAADLFLMWDDSVGALRAVLGDDLPGGGGGNAYSTLTTSGSFASGSATAGASDTLNFRSANNLLQIDITEPGTDDILFTINEANLSFSEVVDDTTPQLGGDLDVNGQEIISVSNGDVSIQPDGTGEVILHALSVLPEFTVQTTDATVTNIATIAIPTDDQRIVTVRLRCHEPATDDTAWWFMRVGVKNVSGTASIIGSAAIDNGFDAGGSAWAATFDVSTSNIVIEVQGEAAHTIDWTATVEVS